MAKLQIILNGAMVEELRLTRGRVTIGRRRYSDVLLDSPVISGDHALIERIGRDVYLEDRESTNGTKLNGKKIRREMLGFGDEIGIGRYILRYCDDNTPAQPGFEKTLMMTEVRSGGNRIDTRPVLEDLRVAKVSAPPQMGVLKILSGPNTGRELALSKNVTTLGKPGVQVAVVARRSQGYFLSQVEGTQGPRVNGTEIGAKPHSLTAGDKIELMGVSMAFALQEIAEKRAGA